jgi:hypothetical protein
MRPSGDGVRVYSSYRFCALGCFCFLGLASAGGTNIAAIIAATKTAAITAPVQVRPRLASHAYNRRRRVPAEGHFRPKLLADIGGGMIPPWDAIVVSNEHQTCSQPRRSETVLHRQ